MNLGRSTGNKPFDVYDKVEVDNKLNNKVSIFHINGSTPVELFKYTFTITDDLWRIKPSTFDIFSIKPEIYLVHKAVCNTTVEEKFTRNKDYYITDDGYIVFNTPMLVGDVISVRSYSNKAGIDYNSVNEKTFHYKVSTLTTKVVNNKRKVLFPYIMNFYSIEVFINGILLQKEVDYTYTKAYLLINNILSDNDTLAIKVTQSSNYLEKYKSLLSGLTENDTALLDVVDSSESSLIQVDWTVSNSNEIIDPTIDVPTLTDTETMTRAMNCKWSSLGSLNI